MVDDIIEVQHGDHTFEVKVIGDRYRCPEDDCRSLLDPGTSFTQHMSAHGYSTRIRKECPVCGEDFATYDHRDQTYCSHSCSTKAQHQPDSKECPECDDTFRPSPSEDSDFCSWNCYVKAHAEEMEMSVCEECDEEFTHSQKTDPRFCSRECYQEWDQDTRNKYD